MTTTDPERKGEGSPEFEPIVFLSKEEPAQLRAPVPAAGTAVRPQAPPRPATRAVAPRRLLEIAVLVAFAGTLFIGGAWLMPFWIAADARRTELAVTRTKRIAPPASPGPDAAPAVEPPLPLAEPAPEPRRPGPQKPAPTASDVRAGPPGTFRARVTVQGRVPRPEATLQVRAAWTGDRYRLTTDGGALDLDCVRLLLAFGPASGALRRDDEIRAGDGAVACRLFEGSGESAWELIHPSRAIVRRDAADWRRSVTKVSREPLEIGGRRLECFRIEGDDEFPGGRRRFRLWFSAEFPFGALRAEQVSADMTVRCDVLDFTLER